MDVELASVIGPTAGAMIKGSIQNTIDADARLAPEGDEWALVQRIVASPAFVRSPFLTNFLLYVCDRKLRGREEEITEYQIGIQALGRPQSFHTGEDNIVRNYARHLRRKLSEYFENEGIDEEITVEIPKGHYRPVFQHRVRLNVLGPPEIDRIPPLDPEPARASLDPEPVQPVDLHKKRRTLWLVLGLAFATLLAVGTWLGMRWHRPQSDATLDRLWGPFWTGDPPLVIFSNAVFLGNSKDGLRASSSVSDPRQAGESPTNETYTGIGEVNSVYELTRLFDGHRATFTLKRSLLVTWDEARRRNLIFIGAASENPALREIDANSDFTHVAGDGYSGIANRHPGPGESALYSRAEQPLTQDYAILAFMPGLESGRKMLIFSGLTTFGTQAAVEFSCTPSGAAQLLKAAAGPGDTIRPFEAVIGTRIAGGVPVQSKLVAIHVH
ncbi:MAG TPA: hypothetical protein VGU25_12890 [Acidobacteriaceae bacterium]|nr:hypothetical protein [Acidobacteriaceae bacterium]